MRRNETLRQESLERQQKNARTMIPLPKDPELADNLSEMQAVGRVNRRGTAGPIKSFEALAGLKDLIVSSGGATGQSLIDPPGQDEEGPSFPRP